MHAIPSSEKRQRNQRGEGARLKDELIDAAMRLLDRSPDAELSLRMVAKEAGVAATSVYRHFADARAMMGEIVRTCWSQMGEHVAGARSADLAESPLDALKAMMSAYVHYAMARPSRYRLLFALTYEADSNIEGPLRPAFRPVRETIEAVAAAGGRLPARDAFTSALMLVSLAHGRIALAHLAPRRRGNLAPEIEVFVREALDQMFAN